MRIAPGYGGMSDSKRDFHRYTAGLLPGIWAVGVILVAINLYHYVQVGTPDGHWFVEVWTVVVAHLLPISVVVVIIGGAHRISHRGGDLARTAIGGVFGGISVGALTAILFMYQGVFSPLSVPIGFITNIGVISGIFIGGIFGLVWSRQVRARDRARENERKTVQLNQRLRVLNRILRHNVRNELNVVAMAAKQLEDPRGETIADSVDDILTVTEQARKQEQLLDRAEEFNRSDPVRLLEAATESLAANVPIQTTVTTEGLPRIHAHPSLQTGLQSLLETLTAHTESISVTIDVDQPPTRPPRSWLSPSQSEGTVLIEIAGADHLPNRFHSVLERGRETELDHLDGVEFWIAIWIVKASSGDVRLSEDGTVLIVELPAA